LVRESGEQDQAYQGLCLVLHANQLQMAVSSKENFYNLMQVCGRWTPPDRDEGVSELGAANMSMLTQIVQALRNNQAELWRWFVQTSMTASGKDRRNVEAIVQNYNIAK
jgi:hypothetical protein